MLKTAPVSTYPYPLEKIVFHGIAISISPPGVILMVAEYQPKSVEFSIVLIPVESLGDSMIEVDLAFVSPATRSAQKPGISILSGMFPVMELSRVPVLSERSPFPLNPIVSLDEKSLSI